MKKLALLFLLSAKVFFAQKLESVYRHAGYGQLENVAMFKDNSGNNVIIGGYAGSGIDVDPGSASVLLPTPYNFGFYILKYDQAGNYLNGFGVAGTSSNNYVTVNDAAKDNSGNHYVVGQFKGVIDFDPSSTTYTVINNSPTSGHGFIAKYDANHNFQWIHHFNNTNYSNFQNVKVDASGKIYLSGYFWGTEDIDFGSATTNVNSSSPGGNFVAVYDNSMNLLQHMVNIGRFNSLIEIDAVGNIYTAGSFNANTDFDPTASNYTMQPVSGYDIYFAKYTSSLSLVWANQIGNTGSESVTHLKIDNNNDLLYSGPYSGVMDFNPSLSTYTLNSFGNDNYLLKLNNNGSFLWAKTFLVTLPSTNMKADAISVDQNNNVYFTGGFSGTQEFNPGSTSYTMQATGDVDGFLAKFSSTGLFEWAFRFGGPTPGFNYTYGHIANISDAGVIDLVGTMRAVTDFDPSPYETSGITAYTSFYNGFIARYNQLSTGIVSPLQACSGTSLGISVPYTLKGIANSGNVFSAQLSDASGSFTNATIIGTLSSTSSGTINAVIPSTLMPSNNYQIRIISSNPSLTGERSLFTFTVNPSPTLTISTSNSLICSSQTSTLQVSGASTYSWLPSGSGTSIIISPSATTNYTAIGTSTNGCSSSISITQSVNPSPTISVNNGTICSGNSFTILPGGASSYTIQGSNSVVSPSISTNYTVVGTSAAGCISVNTATSNVLVNPNPTVTATTSNTNYICVGQSATLTASGANNYIWNPGGSGSVIVVNPTVNTTYTVVGTGGNGCSSSVSITQSVSICSGLEGKIQEEESVFVYPNPNNGIFNIQSHNEGHYVLYDYTGKLLRRENLKKGNNLIEISILSSGYYLLHVIENNKVSNYKIIKD